MQQKTRYANNLRALVDENGWKMRELAQELGVVETTLHSWASSKIPHRYRAEIARLLGCNVQDLAPYYEERGTPMTSATYVMTHRPQDQSRFEAVDEHFSFGKLKTTSIVLDGDGEGVYLPGNIRTHYDPQPATFFDEVMQAKEQIQREQEEKQARGEPYQWNGEKYHLSKIVISREPIREDMVLVLWFKPRDHYTGLATRRCLDDPAFRKKYLTNEWDEPIVGMSCSLGIDLTVVSADGFAFLTQRGKNQSVHQNMYHTSVSEAVSPTRDRSATGREPDLYACARRGIMEELGLYETRDFSPSDIQLLSFSVDTHYALYGLRGIARVSRSAEEIQRIWSDGVKDKTENKHLFAVPFTPEAICGFVFTHQAFAPGALVCLYHSLVHEFGRETVDRAIEHEGKPPRIE
jgi:hypothetical protein